MKHEIKSARIGTRLLFFPLFFLLSACADTQLPSWLTGEPEQSVLTAPRVVSTPVKGAEKAWPNLADVPEAKPVFTSQQVRDARAVEMNSDRLKGQAELERLRNIELYGTRHDLLPQ